MKQEIQPFSTETMDDICEILRDNGGESAISAVKEYFQSRAVAVHNARTSATIRLTRQISDLKDERVAAAVEKFLSYKDKIVYQCAKGRAAMPVSRWLEIKFIESGILSREELSLLPTWAYRQFDLRLYQALLNKRRSNPR